MWVYTGSLQYIQPKDEVTWQRLILMAIMAYGDGVMESSVAPLIPIVEVAFRNDTWWTIPEQMSKQLYEAYITGQDAGYTWDWGPGNRLGSWKPDGEDTSINRYVIDFRNMVQTNIDNQRKRSVRIVWLRRQDLSARFTGDIAA